MFSQPIEKYPQQLQPYQQLKFNKHLISTSESQLSHETQLQQQKLPTSQTLLDLIDDLQQPKQPQTCQKYKKLCKTQTSSRKWSKAETALFYQMLKKYSTDFSIMSCDVAFKAKRSQKQLRNKYRKQSKMRHDKISFILLERDDK